MTELKKYKVEVTFPHDSAISETISAIRYESDGGSINFYKSNPKGGSFPDIRIKSYPAEITIVTLEGINNDDPDLYIEDLGRLGMRINMNKGKIIDLDENAIKVLKFLCRETDEIAVELNNIKKGELIYDKHVYIDGFTSLLNDDLKIVFIRKIAHDYMADIHFCYKGLCVLSAKLHSDNNHWNGEVKSIELFDAYARQETRHELEIPLQQYLDWIEKEIYNPMIKKQKKQKLFKDNLYDEYINTL